MLLDFIILYQDAIYLPRPQSLAMVLGVFKVIITIILHWGPGLRYEEPWKKPAHEAVKLLLGVRCYSPLFNAFFHRL